jgi:hypothetical protein
MLGDVLPRDIHVAQTPVVYTSRDNVTSLAFSRAEGRTRVPLDLSGVTRWRLALPAISAVFDSALVPEVFDVDGNTLVLDLADYAIATSVQPVYLIADDAEHPDGQVLVDNVDCVVQISFRSVFTIRRVAQDVWDVS